MCDLYMEITSEANRKYKYRKMLMNSSSFLQARILIRREREVPPMGEVVAGLPH